MSLVFSTGKLIVMKGFFSVDGGLYRFMSRLLEIFLLNVMWLVCSIPIVTIGASTTAAYVIALKMAGNEEGYIVKPFWKAFRENLKRGIPLGLINLVAAYAMYLDFQIVHITKGTTHMFSLIVFIVGVVLIITHFLYAYAIMARYENTVINTMRNSHEICIRYVLRTLLTLVLVAVEVFVFIFNWTTVFIGIILGPAVIIYTISANARFIFAKIEDTNPEYYSKNSEDEDELPDNGEETGHLLPESKPVEDSEENSVPEDESKGEKLS